MYENATSKTGQSLQATSADNAEGKPAGIVAERIRGGVMYAYQTNSVLEKIGERLTKIAPAELTDQQIKSLEEVKARHKMGLDGPAKNVLDQITDIKVTGELNGTLADIILHHLDQLF